MAAAFWTTAGVTAGALAALLAVTFLIGARTGKHSVMDVAWGAGIMVAGVVGFLACPGHGVAARRYLRLAAGQVPCRPGQSRADHGPRAVAVHQAPQLLR